MPRIERAPLLVCLLLSFACKKSPGPPSEAWTRAQTLHVELVGRYADDAYGLPEMDQVLALLGQVPADSIDTPQAAELQKRILDERKRLASQEAERQKALIAAGPATWTGPAAASESGAGTTGAGPTPVAAASGKPPLTVGMTLDAFRQAYGDCFESRNRLRIENPDGGVVTEKGETFGLKNDPACKDQYPRLAEAVLLFADNKLLAVRAAAEVKMVEVQLTGPPTKVEVQAEIAPDGGLVPKRQADGGYIPVADGGSAPAADGGQ